MHSHSICPEGWRAVTDDETITLFIIMEFNQLENKKNSNENKKMLARKCYMGLYASACVF